MRWGVKVLADAGIILSDLKLTLLSSPDQIKQYGNYGYNNEEVDQPAK